MASRTPKHREAQSLSHPNIGPGKFAALAIGIPIAGIIVTILLCVIALNITALGFGDLGVILLGFEVVTIIAFVTMIWALTYTIKYARSRPDYYIWSLIVTVPILALRLYFYAGSIFLPGQPFLWVI